MGAALIASECADSRLRGEAPGIMCKLDIEKAYDHVNWRHLLNIFRQMGFGEKWVSWISFCIKTVRVENIPTVYLGMPLGHKHKALEIWDEIIKKTENKLARWKAQYLALGGRLTLINSVLDSLPTYVMSQFPIPTKVIKRLDKLRRDFLWQGNKDAKGYKSS
ncbi:unnamed protein product [Withania somnifera]